jgi:tetratricopeptide (TPR) repeat protein
MGLAMGAVVAGRYRVCARLGEGGMGSVYEVEDLYHPGTVWAMKELLDDPSATDEDTLTAHARFDAEIALMRRLSHPRIPAFAASFSDGGQRYFVMDFIPGANLEERLEGARGTLPEREVLRWMADVCEALGYLHSQRPAIIVRDLKPANIMVTPQGDARLIDLGIARTYKPGKLSNTENLGTMTYASPEHLGHTQTDARSDIYSLGATMYHLLTGAEPKPMETPLPGSLRRLCPTLSDQTEQVVIRAMQLSPAQRFQSATELREALLRSLSALNRSSASRRSPTKPATPIPDARATLVVPTVKATAPAATAVGAAVPVPSAVGTATPATGGRVCPRCGFVNRRAARFCARDGSPLTATSSRGLARQPGAAPTTTPVLTATGTAELNLQRATETFAAGKHAQAIRHSEAAIAQGRATHDVYLLLGRARRAVGRHAEAADAFEAAARLRPSADALAEEGQARRTAGQLTQAQIAYTKARQLDPRNPDIGYELGRVCLELGQLSLADGELRESLALRPPDAAEHAPTLIALARVHLARGESSEAVALLRRAVAADASTWEAHFELGRIQLAQQRPSEALRALERAAKLAPDSAPLQTALGVCYHALGRRVPAREALRRAVALDPNDTEAKRLLRQI